MNDSFIFGNSILSCGRFGPARLATTVREIELQRLRIVDAAGLRRAEHFLGAEIRLDRLDFRRRAAGLDQVVDGLVIDPEKPMVAPYSGAMLPMVARSGTASDAAPSPKYSTNFPTTFALRSISVTVSTRSVGCDAFAQTTLEVHADNVGREEIHRLAEHARLGLDPADTPRDDADAVDHGRVRIGADQRVRIIDAVLSDARRARGIRD